MLFESNDHGVEGIEMSRAEYIALKAHLAAMRGYTVGDFRAKIAEVMSTGIDGLNTSDLQQTTSHLETARDFYCAFPELVVYDSPELDEYIEKEAASA
ncbi:MAG TPA: hypothetical protein VG297_06185 [Bryobacteraceae bacterium]|nr:hypothetical protein [Bryobacteraceae bacterium]